MVISKGTFIIISSNEENYLISKPNTCVLPWSNGEGGLQLWGNTIFIIQKSADIKSVSLNLFINNIIVEKRNEFGRRLFASIRRVYGWQFPWPSFSHLHLHGINILRIKMNLFEISRQFIFGIWKMYVSYKWSTSLQILISCQPLK